jgi:hypothetical protein
MLANDINISGSWKPIEDFRGTLDGRGYVISGLHTFSSQNGHSAGLFGVISSGDVVIRNLGVRGSIRADARTTSSRVQFSAGGLIGRVSRGNVLIENCFFDGNIDVQTRIVDWVSAIQSVGSILTFTPGLNSIISLISGEALAAILANNSYAYAGGLIGLVDGNASVTINNSYTTGNVYAFASTLRIYRYRDSHAHVGGLVGYKHSSRSSTLTINNCYSTSNIMADSAKVVFSAKHLYAGGLIGYGSASTSQGRNYRLSSQVVRGHRINNTGSPLSRTAMQNQVSFVGWTFDSGGWTINLTKNTGYPYPWIFDNSIPPKPVQPLSAFENGFSVIRPTTTSLEAELALHIDKDITLFSTVLVNDIVLLQDEHYRVYSGSTIITLLSNFLKTLDDGFHTITVSFTDGMIVEEQFIVVDSPELDVPAVSIIYFDNELVYSTERGGFLIDENYLDLFDDDHSLRVIFEDGTVHEEGYENDFEDNDNNNPRKVIIIVAAIIVVAIVIFVSIQVFRLKGKQKRTPDLLQSAHPKCPVCGHDTFEGDSFCAGCGASSSNSVGSV